jgi:transposase
VIAEADIDRLDPHALRDLVLRQSAELSFKDAVIAKLTHENAVLKRLKFALSRAEGYTPEQKSLLEETLDTDLAAVDAEVDATLGRKRDTEDKRRPRREPLPAQLPRREIRHEPASTTCGCGQPMKRIGEEVAEKLDYVPGVFTVERHVRGQWACACCQTLAVAPVAPHVIDKGVPTAGLLAQVLVAKYQDHLPLHRQEHIFARAGLAIPRSTLADWVGRCGVALQPLVTALADVLRSRGVLHADETPVAMLKPVGARDGKTHRAYLWSYCTTPFDDVRAVVFDFAETRGGQHVRAFLRLDPERPLAGWRGKLVTDDFSGYKACFELGVTEVGCMAHARRKFHELWVHHKSAVGERALRYFQRLYAYEDRARGLDPEQRLRLRRRGSRRVLVLLHRWLLAQRERVPAGSATMKAIDYSLKRWVALTRFVDDAMLPIDNNWVENRIRPIAIGRSNWLFAGSLRAGQRAAAVMSLVHSAQLNGLDPHRYLKDVLERLPTQLNSRIEELLPHRWVPADAAS